MSGVFILQVVEVNMPSMVLLVIIVVIGEFILTYLWFLFSWTERLAPSFDVLVHLAILNDIQDGVHTVLLVTPVWNLYNLIIIFCYQIISPLDSDGFQILCDDVLCFGIFNIFFLVEVDLVNFLFV